MDYDIEWIQRTIIWGMQRLNIMHQQTKNVYL